MIMQYKKISENEKIANNFHYKTTLKRVFSRLIDQRQSARPLYSLVSSYIQQKNLDILSKYLQLWRQDHLLTKQRKLNELIAFQAYYKNRYAAFFRALKLKIEEKRFYSKHTKQVQLFHTRAFFTRWRKELENVQVSKAFVQKRTKKILKKYFNGLKKFFKLKALRTAYETNKSNAMKKKTWNFLRETYRTRNIQYKLLEQADRCYSLNLMQKGIKALSCYYQRKRDLLKKMIAFRKKRALHIKQIFLDIIHFKKEKTVQRGIIVKKFQQRYHLQKLRSAFSIFNQGIYLSRSRKQMLELAVQSREYRLKSQVFGALKNNLGGFWEKLDQADLVQAQRSQSSLMKCFFSWKFFAREKAELAIKQDQLRDYLERKQKSLVFKR